MLGQCNFMALAGHHMKAITSWPVRTAETGLRQPGISTEYYHYGSEQQGTQTDPAHIPPQDPMGQMVYCSYPILDNFNSLRRSASIASPADSSSPEVRVMG